MKILKIQFLQPQPENEKNPIYLQPQYENVKNPISTATARKC